MCFHVKELERDSARERETERDWETETERDSITSRTKANDFAPERNFCIIEHLVFPINKPIHRTWRKTRILFMQHFSVEPFFFLFSFFPQHSTLLHWFWVVTWPLMGDKVARYPGMFYAFHAVCVRDWCQRTRRLVAGLRPLLAAGEQGRWSHRWVNGPSLLLLQF